jgi:hypothetical protein
LVPFTYRSIGPVVFLVTSAEQWLFVFVVI